MLTIVQKSDAEIQKQVMDELHWDCRTETSPITVTVQNGAVTLGGTVKYYAIKHAAAEAAHRIAGVISVKDNLVVKIPYGEFRGDCEIAEAVSHAYTWNVLVPHERITVVADNGIVHLYGTVDCISQREEAERVVVNLLGVRGIVNHIAVKASPVEVETACTEIQNSLERQAVVDTRQVRVHINRGAVHLSGKVPSWNQRCAVVSAAGFAHGARQVVDELTIAASA